MLQKLNFSILMIATFIIFRVGEIQAQTLIITQNGNLRSGPSIKHEVTGKVTVDMKVTQLEQSGSWYKIKLSDGKVGWINQTLIATKKIEKKQTNLKLGPVAPESFSPKSNIMDKFMSVTSFTRCQLGGMSTSMSWTMPWTLELLENHDIVEYSKSIDGIGASTGSVIYSDQKGALDPFIGPVTLEDGTVMPGILTKNVTIKVHQRGRTYMRTDSSLSGIVESYLPHLSHFIGIGSIIRFRSFWVLLGDKRYRKGGFKVLRDDIEFLPDTEVATENDAFRYIEGKWRQISAN